jgi:hypothetical protein
LTLRIGPARAEVCSYVQRATIPSKKVIPYINKIFINTTHAIKFNVYVSCCFCAKENTFSPLQVKNKPHDGQSENAFVLGSMDCNEVVPDADEAVPDVGEAVPNVAKLFLMMVNFPDSD